MGFRRQGKRRLFLQTTSWRLHRRQKDAPPPVIHSDSCLSSSSREDPAFPEKRRGIFDTSSAWTDGGEESERTKKVRLFQGKDETFLVLRWPEPTEENLLNANYEGRQGRQSHSVRKLKILPVLGGSSTVPRVFFGPHATFDVAEDGDRIWLGH